MPIVRKIAEKLTKDEILVLDILKDGKQRSIFEISKELGEDIARISRAVMFLENKGLIESKFEEKEVLELTEKGKKYLERDLPEDLLYNTLLERKEIPLEELPLEKDERSIAIGTLKKMDVIEIKDGKVKLVGEYERRSDRFRKLDLSQEEIREFIKRGLLKKEKKVIKIVSIKEEGIKALEIAKKLNLVDELTRDLIITGKWREVKFRRYDVESPLPKIYGGRRHLYRKILDEVIDIFVSMGFKEMKHSPIVELPLLNFDALIVPYDHPAREVQDTFYTNLFGEFRDKELEEKIKKIHLRVFKKFDEKMSKKLLLRTHTTATTVRTMMKHKEGKFFIVDRVFRNETIDWKHLIEFYQVEGIIIEEDVNLKVLIGTLKEFYKRLGFEKVRVMPSFFPYTEPSLQIMVYWNGRWLELGGAGIFRREINEIFGIGYPIAAWGLGLERLAMIKYGIKDIRLVWPRTRISQIKEYRVV